MQNMAEIDYSKQFKQAIAKRKEAEDKLLSSDSDSNAWLRFDVQKRQAEEEVDRAISDLKKSAWYTDTEWDTSQGNKGALSKVWKVFDWFNKPLRMWVGAIESITWKWDVEGVWNNMIDNAKEWGDTFGTLFEKYNMPFAKPIGLIADIALDPLNLLGGLGVATKLAKAWKIGSAGKVLASQMGRALPDTVTWLGRIATGIAWAPLKIAGKITKAGWDTFLWKAIGKVDEASDFLGTMGRKIDNAVNNVADTELQKIGSSSLDYLMEKSQKGVTRRQNIDAFMDKIPGVGNAWKAFKSDADNYYTRKLIEQDMRNGSISDSNKLNFSINAARKWGTQLDPMQLSKIEDATEALRLAGKDSGIASISDPNDFYKALGYEAELDQIRKKQIYDKKYEDLKVNKNKITGVKWYDDVQAKVAKATEKSEAFKWFANFLGEAGGLFKTMKLANPAAILNNYIGSFGLAGMGGLMPFAKDNLDGLMRVTNAMYTGKDATKVYDEIFSGPMGSFVTRNPELAESILNLDPKTTQLYQQLKWTTRSAEELDKTLKKGFKAGIFAWVGFGEKLPTNLEELLGPSLSPEIQQKVFSMINKSGKPLALNNDSMLDIQRMLADKSTDIKKYIIPLDMSQEPIKLTAKTFEKIGEHLQKSGIMPWVDVKNAMDVSRVKHLYDKASIMGEISPEVENVMGKLRQFGESGKLWSGVTKFGVKQIEKLMEWFGSPDQIFRLNTMLQMTNRWLTFREIENLAQTYKFAKGDIVQKGSKYLIAPDKAIDIVSDIFINYDAIPAAVKILRNLPIMGAPFASFSVSSLQKTLKAAARNPEFFSYMESLQNDLWGTLTPLDKEALDSKYYQYIKDGNYIKLPFFKENPIFLNMTNYLPYYAFNNLGDEGRGYESSGVANVISAFDKLPIMKDPIGSTLFDYLIQPLILRDTEDTLKGAFGQTLFPKDATTWEKAFYGARNLMEAYFPTALSIAGAPAGLITWGALSETLIPGMDRTTLEEAIPSYRFRQLYNAVQGKSAVGVEGKEAPARRTLRNIASYFGIGTAPIDTTYIENQTKKEINK